MVRNDFHMCCQILSAVTERVASVAKTKNARGIVLAALACSVWNDLLSFSIHQHFTNVDTPTPVFLAVPLLNDIPFLNLGSPNSTIAITSA